MLVFIIGIGVPFFQIICQVVRDLTGSKILILVVTLILLIGISICRLIRPNMVKGHVLVLSLIFVSIIASNFREDKYQLYLRPKDLYEYVKLKGQKYYNASLPYYIYSYYRGCSFQPVGDSTIPDDFVFKGRINILDRKHEDIPFHVLTENELLLFPVEAFPDYQKENHYFIKQKNIYRESTETVFVLKRNNNIYYIPEQILSELTSTH
jgi:hypothetical protein